VHHRWPANSNFVGTTSPMISERARIHVATLSLTICRRKSGLHHIGGNIGVHAALFFPCPTRMPWQRASSPKASCRRSRRCALDRRSAPKPATPARAGQGPDTLSLEDRVGDILGLSVKVDHKGPSGTMPSSSTAISNSWMRFESKARIEVS